LACQLGILSWGQGLVLLGMPQRLQLLMLIHYLLQATYHLPMHLLSTLLHHQ